MSMKWVGDASIKPTAWPKWETEWIHCHMDDDEESALMRRPLWLWDQVLSGWSCILWPQAAVEGAETHCKWETERIYYCHFDCRCRLIIHQDCILMTCNHTSRYKNNLFMYEVDLIWVWRGWGASIITYTMIQWETDYWAPSAISPSLPVQISVWGCIFTTDYSRSKRC